VGLLALLGLGVAWRSYATSGAVDVTTRDERLVKASVPPGLGFTEAGKAEMGDEGSRFRESQVLNMVLHRQEIAGSDHVNFVVLRDRVLLALFSLYILVCCAIPFAFYDDLSCEDGLPWLCHLPFLAIFMATKAAEMWVYRNDPTLASPLPVIKQGRYNIMAGFAFKFSMSFMAFFDAYQDNVTAATAFKCQHDASQTLAPWMLGYYIFGVVGLQWAVLSYLSYDDSSRSCWFKILHMESIAARLTLPPKKKKTWALIQLSRTVAEDVPQAILQSLFVLRVGGNPFIIFSIACAVGSSLMAAKDALTRKLLASGGVQQQVLLQAADEHVHSVHGEVFKPGCGLGVSKLVLARRSGRQELQFGGQKDRCNECFFLQHGEFLTEARIAHHNGQVPSYHLKALRSVKEASKYKYLCAWLDGSWWEAIEFWTSRGRRFGFGQTETFDFHAVANTNEHIVGLAVQGRSVLRITGIKQASIPESSGTSAKEPRLSGSGEAEADGGMKNLL